MMPLDFRGTPRFKDPESCADCLQPKPCKFMKKCRVINRKQNKKIEERNNEADRLLNEK
jgi:hypothetical protein